MAEIGLATNEKDLDSEIIEDPEKKLWILIKYVSDEKGRILAHAFIRWKHHGDEAMKLLEERILGKSEQFNLPIIHQAGPWNDASTKMFERHGYTQIGIRQHTHDPIFEKEYRSPKIKR